MRILTEPLPLYFARLPDDDRAITSTIVGVLVRGIDKVFLRGAWEPDTWDRFKMSKWWNIPRPLVVEASREDPGVTLAVAVPVPLRGLPRAMWGEEYAGEEWNPASRPPKGAVGLLPLGNLVRYERAFAYGGEMPAEAMHTLAMAVSGRTKEPWEQGL